MQPELRLKVTRVVALLVVVALSLAIFIYRDQAKQFAALGYPGIFIISFLAYATVFLPAPGIAIVFTMGAIFNPWVVSLTAGAGAALGELVGYLAGFSGQTVIENVNIYNRLSHWMEKNGALTVILFSAIPNPFFDIAGVAAGALKMPVRRFLLFCWIGETIKMTFFSFAGAGVLLKLFS
jgi:uncharacterized membrane protein YdjX (TVP38/TMEM64 family)